MIQFSSYCLLPLCAELCQFTVLTPGMSVVPRRFFSCNPEGHRAHGLYLWAPSGFVKVLKHRVGNPEA